MNINKLFPFLSIRTKLIVAFSMLSFIPLAIVGTIGIYNNINTMRETALENLQHNVGRLIGIIIANIYTKINFVL